MKAVVTGGAGFIGSHLVEKLVEMGFYVIILDDLSTGKKENLNFLRNTKNNKFVKGSIVDLNLLMNLFKDVDYVFHHAAIASVEKSIENPLLINKINTEGTLNILIAARDKDVKKVIYASSSAVYGDSPETPKKENMKPNPKSPYGISKLIGEYYCEAFSDIYGLKTVSLRYFNVYGPRQNPSSEYAAVIPKFIVKVMKNDRPPIYGDGNQTRDFIFVKDVVNANILAIEKDIEGTFNIGSGKSISIKDIAYKIMRLLDKHLEPIYAPQRKGDVINSVSDISLARKRLGYKPRFDIEEGLKETIEYFKTQIKI